VLAGYLHLMSEEYEMVLNESSM
ncbi:uncharacterized protein METZ01_LOCUS229142, partial [marine metagenome]